MKAKRPALREEMTLQRLAGNIAANSSTRTGVVSLAVSAPSPELAHALASRILELVSNFNKQTRQSQAAAERRFTEERLVSAKAELRQAEDRLQSFLASNRYFKDDPSLGFAYQRLQRDVQLKQDLFASLSQSYEKARIDEVRNTPVITVIDEPHVPARADARGTVKKTLLALIAGMMIGIALAFWREAESNVELTESEAYREYIELRNATIADVIHPWKPVRRIVISKIFKRPAEPTVKV